MPLYQEMQVTKTHIDVELLSKEATVDYLTKVGKKLPDGLQYQKGPFLAMFVPEDKHRKAAFQKFTESRYLDGDRHRRFVGDAFLTEVNVLAGNNVSKAEFYEANEGVIGKLHEMGLIGELKREKLVDQYRQSLTQSMADKVRRRMAEDASKGFGRK